MELATCETGCLVQRWLLPNYGSSISYEKAMNYDNRVCVPVGARFVQKRTSTEVIYEGDYKDYALDVISSNEATLTLRGVNGEENSYTLETGESITISFPGEEATYTFYVAGIGYSEDNSESNPNYVTMSDSYAYYYYCEYDGYLYNQKQSSDGGDWIECQSNYECKSNLCLEGECVEVRKLTSDLKNMWNQVWCKLSNLFNEDDYTTCLLG
jgi:hypothetical protein